LFAANRDEELDDPPTAMQRIDIGRGYSVMRDPSRAGGLPEHYSVFKGRKELPGRIIAETGEVIRHANKDPKIPRSVLKELSKRGWIPSSRGAAQAAAVATGAAAGKIARGGGIVGAILGLFLVEELHAPSPPVRDREPQA
jgi:hypothetical protein